MLTRILTSITAFPIMAVIVYFGGLPTKLLIMALSMIGMYEVYRAIEGKYHKIHLLSYIFILIYYMGIDYLNSDYFLILIFVYIILNLIFMVYHYGTISPINCAVNIFVFLYAGVLMSGIYLTRVYDYGQYFVWLIFISAWGSDTFAYFTGITIGKHKLTPRLSPNKTVEGSIGGVIGATLLAFIYGIVINRFFSFEVNIILFFVIVASVGAIFSQLGDLTASAIKRYTNIKDYGKIFPGHGGIIDRFDSVLFTAPIAYIIMYLLI